MNGQPVASATITKKPTITTRQIHQRSCSVQPTTTTTIMIPDDNLNGILAASIQYPPKVCVDYLSHEWNNEDEIWTSWKVMSKRKKAVANGARLENASWRNWAKQKYNLKTVNPEKLNWMKDSDVTWLYGPLHTAWSNHIDTLPKSSTTEDKLNLLPSSTKSCLKKKSIAEILRPTFGRKYGSLVTSNSDTQLYKKDQEVDVDSDCETASTCSSNGPTTPTSGPSKSPILPATTERNSNRKIQFNDCVEQCIAVESDEDPDLHDSENSGDDGIVMKISSKDKRKDCSTICKLAPTRLKEDRLYNNEYSALYSNHGRRRATTNSSNSSNSTSSGPSVTPPSTSTSTSTSSTTTTSSYEWMNEEDDDDDLDVDLLDFDLPNSTHSSSTPSHSSRYHPGEIILSSPYDDYHDDDDIVEKAVNIASGVRDIVHWVFKGRGIF